jgi:hypothetical protein
MVPVYVDEAAGSGEAPDSVSVAVGDAASSLAEVAADRHVELIVVGSTAQVGITSAARRLLPLADVPVVVMPADARVPDLARPAPALPAAG